MEQQNRLSQRTLKCQYETWAGVGGGSFFFNYSSERVPHCAAHLQLVSGLRRSDHITPLTEDLHWLPIGERMDFKILLLTFKILNDLVPCYLSSLLLKYQSARLLRSSDRLLFPVPSGSWTPLIFILCAPKKWNNLPDH